jgi:hypothetical protein
VATAFRGVGIAVGVTLAGLSCIVASAVLDRWISELLLNIGVTLLLFVPLLALTQRLQTRVEEGEAKSERQFEAVRGQLAADRHRIESDLSSIREEFNRLRNQDDTKLGSRVLDDLTEVPSSRTLSDVLKIYTAKGLISNKGIRILIASIGVYAWLVLIDSGLQLTLQSREGAFICRLVWRSEEPTPEFMVRVSREVSKASLDASEFDPVELFVGTRQLIELAERSRAGRGDYSAGGMIQLLPSNWAIFDRGIGAIGDLPPYFVSFAQLASGRIGDRAIDGSGQNAESLDEAIHIARQLGFARRS